MDGYTLTSKVGRFVFDSAVRLSHAKLVRDTIMGQILKPVPNLPRVKDEKTAISFMRDEVAGPVSQTPFSFYPA